MQPQGPTDAARAVIQRLRDGDLQGADEAQKAFARLVKTWFSLGELRQHIGGIYTELASAMGQLPQDYRYDLHAAWFSGILAQVVDRVKALVLTARAARSAGQIQRAEIDWLKRLAGPDEPWIAQEVVHGARDALLEVFEGVQNAVVEDEPAVEIWRFLARKADNDETTAVSLIEKLASVLRNDNAWSQKLDEDAVRSIVSLVRIDEVARHSDWLGVAKSLIEHGVGSARTLLPTTLRRGLRGTLLGPDQKSRCAEALLMALKFPENAVLEEDVDILMNLAGSPHANLQKVSIAALDLVFQKAQNTVPQVLAALDALTTTEDMTVLEKLVKLMHGLTSEKYGEGWKVIDFRHLLSVYRNPATRELLMQYRVADSMRTRGLPLSHNVMCVLSRILKKEGDGLALMLPLGAFCTGEHPASIQRQVLAQLQREHGLKKAELRDLETVMRGLSRCQAWAS